MSYLKYRLELLEPTPDTVQQRIEIRRGGSEDVQTIMLDVNDRELVFDVRQDDPYELSLVYVDDAGNDSLPAILSGVAVDTLPPAPPSGFGSLTLIAEQQIPAVVEEPVVDEPVVDEPVVDEPVGEEPVAEEPVAEEPVSEEPVAEEPAAEDEQA